MTMTTRREKTRAVRNTLVRDTLDLSVPLAEKRAAWERTAASLPLVPGTRCTPETVGGVPCLWVSASSARANATLVYVHGGGLVEGSVNTHREFASRLSDRCGLQVLLVDYRLAPEHPFPAAREDVRAVLAALAPRETGTDTAHRVFAGGDSSGAGLVLSALLNDESHTLAFPAVQKLVLLSGVYDHTVSGSSYTNKRVVDPVVSEAVLHHCAALYAGAHDTRNPLISPLFATFSTLPPTLVMVGTDEILLSDSERLASTLSRAGIEVDLHIGQDLWHAWPLYPDLPDADEALETIRVFLHAGG